MSKVLDAYALMTYLEREEGFETVKSLLTQSLKSGISLLMTSVNLGEVLYITLRELGQDKTDEVVQIVENLPIEVVDVDMALVREAAQIKAQNKMSYADCFAAALAKNRNLPVVTGDPEFNEISSEIDVLWL